MKVFIGHDTREEAAYDLAYGTLLEYSNMVPTALRLKDLEAQGLLDREIVHRDGQMYDVISQAPMSTQFAISRFLTPILAQQGLALFTDCDVMFMDDVKKLVSYFDYTKAVWVVKHKHEGSEGKKMDGQIQTSYARKNWSSVMLFNCDHPANRRLTLKMINSLPGRDLHRFCWLEDHEIGELPRAWNWLVGVQPKPDVPKIAHFTLGGPWISGWQPREHDEIWTEEYKRIYGEQQT